VAAFGALVGISEVLSATSQIARASRRQNHTNKISTPETLHPAARSMNGKIESRERPGPSRQSFSA
jgi:hypothetical protein